MMPIDTASHFLPHDEAWYIRDAINRTIINGRAIIADAILQCDSVRGIDPVINAISNPHRSERSTDSDISRAPERQRTSTELTERITPSTQPTVACDGGSFVISGDQKEATDYSVLVAIPAYNEEESITSVVHSARRHADTVVVVDDGSSDETAANARAAGANVISHEYNRGYGAALQTAFEIAADRDIECLVTIDGDGQHDPDDIPTVIERATDADVNVAIGSRFVGNQKNEIPLYRRLGLSIINVLTNLSMGAVSSYDWVQDTQSGFRAYDRQSIELLAETNALGNDMDASLDVLYQVTEAGYTLDEVGTTIDYGVKNANSQHPLWHGLTIISAILRMIRRNYPVLILSAFSGVIAVVLYFAYCRYQ